MKNTIVKIAASLLLAMSTFGHAQTDSCWTLLLLERSHTLEERPDMATVSSHGFYLYRNCIYDISLKNDRRYNGRLVDIKQDTLFFTNYFNEAVAALNHHTLDTMIISVNSLDKLNLIADRSMGIFRKESFSKYEFIFKKQPVHCSLHTEWAQLYSNDTAHYELVPFLTAQGLDLLYEEKGSTYYYQGSGLEKQAEEPADTTYDVRNFIWYTPNEVEKINGLAIGMMADNMKNEDNGRRDSLKINGVNAELNFMYVFGLFNGNFSGPYADSIGFYDQSVKNKYEVIINGLNLSMVGSSMEMKINGLNIAGANTVVDDINGVSVSGLNNFCYVLNGLSVAAARNRAQRAKGVQVALYNKATDLKGVQIGLWNVNGRRSLPLINWQFKPSKHAI